MKQIKQVSALALLLILTFAGTAAADAPKTGQQTFKTPVVIFPAFHFTRLAVDFVQLKHRGCPLVGHFEDWYQNPIPTSVSQVCQDKLLTLDYDNNPAKPMAKRFSNQPGVQVTIPFYGTTRSAPYYEPMYQFLEANGYRRNLNIRVAGYDSRLTPDMDGFLSRTVKLIEDTYKANGNTPVHLVAHSNGPLYAQYLLTHTRQVWKNKYIHGFTPIAGNWPGQGLFYTVFFTGFNAGTFLFPDNTANAVSSATMYLSHPSSYMSSSDPAIFGNQEVIIESLAGNRLYTPVDQQQLFQDAGLPLAKTLANHYIGFVKFADPANFPNVDVYAEKGSGIETIVGTQLTDLSVGQVITNQLFFTRDGDSNQEDITNDSIAVWNTMPCYRFELHDTNPGNHFLLPEDAGVLNRLLSHLQNAKSVCP